jgi:hypothetical protein
MYGNLVASVGIFSNGTNKAQIIGTGKQETLKLDENIGAARTSTVTMTAVSTVDLPSIVVSCNVSQIAATYVWGEPSLAENVPSSGGTITFTIVSKLNGRACPITQVVTSLSGATIAEQPTLIDSSRGEYRFKVSVPENTSTQDRTFTVTATQFGSSDTKVWNVTQLKKSTALKAARLMAGFSFNGTDYSKVVVTNARLIATGSDYGGGLVENLSLRVVNKKTAAIYGESGNLGNFNVPNNGSVSVPITSLPNSSNSNNNVGVEVWFGNPSRYQQTFDIVQLDIN